MVTAALRLPPSTCCTTLPLFRSSTRLKPAAIPVIDGCGVTILRGIFLLVGLEVRRRATRRRGEVVALRPRERFAALKARQPFLNPILAYFFGSPGFAMPCKASRHPHLRETHLIRVALVTGLFPLFTCINEVLIDFTSTGARVNVCDHSSSSARSATKGSNWWVHLLQFMRARLPGMICLGLRIIPFTALHSGQCIHSS